jgi:hypothetical protein
MVHIGGRSSYHTGGLVCWVRTSFLLSRSVAAAARFSHWLHGLPLTHVWTALARFLRGTWCCFNRHGHNRPP